jgi:hypothetical protein
MKRFVLVVLTVFAAAASAACFDFGSKTSPSPTTSQVLGGTWVTTQSLPGVSGSIQDSCVNFQWNVTEFSGTSGAGTFSATCMGNVQVAGSASGTLAGSTVNWSANATGTAPGLPPCPIALTGTATLEASNRIRIPYSGTTCLGPVSGTEIVTR